MCIRHVARVYGANGDPARELGDLAEAIDAAGWGYFGFPDPVARLRELPADPFLARGTSGARPSWRPRAGLADPPGLRLPDDSPRAVMPGVSLHVQAERANASSPGPGRASLRLWRRNSGKPGPSPVYQPLQVSEDDVATLAEQAFARSAYAVAIQISITYYSYRK